MAYEPTAWQSGDVVTAEKLNKIEDGIANSASNQFLEIPSNAILWNHEFGLGALDYIYLTSSLQEYCLVPLKYVPELGDSLKCYARHSYMESSDSTGKFNRVIIGKSQSTSEIAQTVSHFWANNMEIGAKVFGSIPLLGDDTIVLVKNTAENRGKILSVAAYPDDLNSIMQTAGSFLLAPPLVERIISLKLTILKAN